MLAPVPRQRAYADIRSTRTLKECLTAPQKNVVGSANVDLQMLQKCFFVHLQFNQ